MRPPERPLLSPGSRQAAAGALVVAGLVFVGVVSRHQAPSQWMFFRYARAALLALVFGVACLSAGHALLVRALGRTLPLGEHVAVAFPLGVVAFGLASFAFGVCGLYGAPFFIGGPLLVGLLAYRDVARFAGRVWARRRRVRVTLGPRDAAVLVAGLAGVALVWLPLLSPANASYDARWYHLPLAEHYVAQGGIAPFPEGWVFGAVPHLASLLYAWALSGTGVLFDKVETAAHMEFVVFLATLWGIAAVVSRVLRARAPLAWAATFLFPGIFCYDSGLVLGGDHVAALFAPPIFLLALRAWRSSDELAWPVLLGAAVAGALLTKYTAVIVAPIAAASLLARGLLDAREKGARAFVPALVSLLTVAAVSAPHWLKNAVFYGDPFFPSLRGVVHEPFWSQPAEAPYQRWFALRRPPPGAAGVVEMAQTLVTFSFSPHDFPQYHGEVPVFGSLFTLLTPLLVFFRRERRLLALYLAAYSGVAAWFWIHQYDRYLQAVVPWMAGAVAATLWLACREGGALRAAALGLAGLQLLWGSDVPFLPSHMGAGGQSILAVAAGHLGGAYTKPSAERLVVQRDWERIARALPRGARVLVHEEENHFGLGAATVMDYSGDQGLLYWGEEGAATAREIHARLRSLGVTHVVWAARLDHASDTPAAGLAFFDFVTHHVKPIGEFGALTLGALGAEPPHEPSAGLVDYRPCPDEDSLFAPGLYPLPALARSKGDPRTVAAPLPGVTPEEARLRARYVVHDVRCHGPLPPTDDLEILAARGQAMMLVKRAARGPTVEGAR